MTSNIILGSKVQWKWMGRIIQGTVKEIFFEPISKTIKGKVIKRNGTAGNPAFLVESTAGNIALKLGSELELFQKESPQSVQPKMFKK
jgi:hypothetical protein